MKPMILETLVALGFAVLCVPSVSHYERPPMLGIHAIVTAYNSTPDQTDATPFLMASGKRVYSGAVACPGRFAFGTKVIINHKTYVCEDRMNLHFREEMDFDIWLPEHDAAIQFGRQHLGIMVLQ